MSVISPNPNFRLFFSRTNRFQDTKLPKIANAAIDFRTILNTWLSKVSSLYEILTRIACPIAFSVLLYDKVFSKFRVRKNISQDNNKRSMDLGDLLHTCSWQDKW